MDEWLIEYTRMPTDYNSKRRMIVRATDRDEAMRTWEDALTRQGVSPSDYSPRVSKYAPGALGTVVAE